MRTLLTVALVTLCISVQAAEPKTVVSGLYNPCGVAIQPGTGTVFVADSGALRVVRIIDGKIQNVITDFPKDAYGKGEYKDQTKFDIGPLGLAFIDKNTLVVGGGGNIDDKELLRVYKVPAVGKSIKADDMCGSAQLPANAELKAEGNYYGVAVSGKTVYVTCNGDDTKGWVAKAEVSDDGVKFKRFIATKEATNVDAPVAVAISPYGQVVIGQMGEITVPEDGLVTIYNAKNGKMTSNSEVGLSDITGIAFSPGKPSKMYATDFSWHDRSLGGLFQLIGKGKGKDRVIQAKKIVSLDKPTALAFGDDGTLYITVIAGGEGKGKLLSLKP